MRSEENCHWACFLLPVQHGGRPVGLSLVEGVVISGLWGEGQCFERRSVRYQWWEWRWPDPEWGGEAEKVDLTLCCDSLCAAVGCCSLMSMLWKTQSSSGRQKWKIRSYGYPAVIWIVWTRISVINDGKEMKISALFWSLIIVQLITRTTTN